MFFLMYIEGEIVILLLNKESVRMWDGGVLLWTLNWDFWMMYNVANYLDCFVTKAGLLTWQEELSIIDVTFFLCEFIQRMSGRYFWGVTLVLVVKVVSVVIKHDM